MADKVSFGVTCTPQEELTNENSGTHYVMASEVNTSLGGSGQATCASYAGTAANQGYLNATVNYLEGVDSANTTDAWLARLLDSSNILISSETNS